MGICRGCKYFDECGDKKRTRPCNGYAAGTPKKHKAWKPGKHIP